MNTKDDSFDSEDRRRTRTIFNVGLPHQLELNESEEFDCSESILNQTMNSNTLTNEREPEEEEYITESEEDVCDQLRDMTPEKISQLLNKLDGFHGLHISSSQEDAEIEEDHEEIPQQKKGKTTKIKKEPKKTKGKKVDELEYDDKEEHVPTKVEVSNEEIAKTEKLKRGQKEAADVDHLISKESNDAIVNSKVTGSIPSEVVIDKKPNKSKSKKANESENDREEPVSKVVASTEDPTKTTKLKRGQKEAADVDNLNSKDPNKVVVNSKSTDTVPSEVLNDKKPTRSRKAGNDKGKEATEEKVNIQEKSKNKETSSKPKIPSKPTNVNEKTATKDKKPPIKKNQEVEESKLKAKSSKTTNKTDDLKASKTNKGGSNENISKRTRANKSPTVAKTKENIQEEEAIKVDEKPIARSLRNKNQTDQDKVSKPEEKEKGENPKRKVNGGKQKATENKENMTKVVKEKVKTEPVKKEKPVPIKGSSVATEEIVTKRVTKKK